MARLILRAAVEFKFLTQTDRELRRQSRTETVSIVGNMAILKGRYFATLKNSFIPSNLIFRDVKSRKTRIIGVAGSSYKQKKERKRT